MNKGRKFLKWNPKWDQPYLKHLAKKMEKPLPNFGKAMDYEQAFPAGLRNNGRDKCPYCHEILQLVCCGWWEKTISHFIAPATCIGNVVDGKCIEQPGFVIKAGRIAKDCCRKCGGGFLARSDTVINAKEEGFVAILRKQRLRKSGSKQKREQ